MSVYLNKARGRWVYEFVYKGQRYQGYCLNPVTNQPASNKTEAKRIEEIIKGAVKKRPADQAADAKPMTGSISWAQAVSFYMKALEGRADQKNARTYSRELLVFFGPATALEDIEERIPAFIEFSKSQPRRVFTKIDDDGRPVLKDIPGTLRSPQTTNAYLQFIVRVFRAFRQATEHRRIRHLICEPPSFSFLPEPKRTPTPIPHDKALKLLNDDTDPGRGHVKLAFIICHHTGMRETELTTLRDREYIEARRVIMLDAAKTKTNTGRAVFVNDAAHAAILECRKVGNMLWAEMQKDPQLAEYYRDKFGIIERGDINLILYRPKGIGLPRPVKRVAFRAWRAMRDKSAPGHRWHDTRAAFCTNLLDAGADIIQVMELAGHQDIATTRKYLKISGRQLRAAADMLTVTNPLPMAVQSLTAVPDKSKRRPEGRR